MPGLREVVISKVELCSLAAMHISVVDVPRLQSRRKVRLFWPIDGPCLLDVDGFLAAIRSKISVAPTAHVFCRGEWVPCVLESRVAELWEETERFDGMIDDMIMDPNVGFDEFASALFGI